MISAVLTAFNEAFRLARQHAWTVAVVLAVLLVLKKQLLQLKTKFWDGRRIGSSGSSSKSLQQNDRQDAVRQARLRQQELLSARARVAAAERQERAAAERREQAERAQQEAREKRRRELGRGRRLGGGGGGGGGTDNTSNTGGSGYNPMQPWTANSSGYRAARRQVRRRG